ncbi:sulfotransferase family protein [Pseudotabrizicola formosa]|uniref:sulfotransferase family protein n=1 Tax=Pseudotabrizicola formosa TaxID=2030009 RepID=UPI000CD08F5C|nr:sulfotransferase [Pseudotabrizicola formosa]
MTQADQAQHRRFIIVGLPRSGTTYLMTLLNSHRLVTCSGELFNPYSVIETAEPNYDPDLRYKRDWGPRYFMRQFFERHEAGPWQRIGFKLMLGHNIRVLSQLPDLAQVRIIYVHRDNRLAQVASFLKAMQTKTWAQTRRSRAMTQKIVASPEEISHRWHEYATMDFLFAQWLGTLPNPSLTLEYCELFKPGFNARICGFLGIETDPDMNSPLIKQGSNRVLDRFATPGPIESYMRYLGRANWLEDELV